MVEFMARSLTSLMGLADAITNHISCRYLYTARDFNTSASPTVSIRDAGTVGNMPGSFRLIWN